MPKEKKTVNKSKEAGIESTSNNYSVVERQIISTTHALGWIIHII